MSSVSATNFLQRINALHSTMTELPLSGHLTPVLPIADPHNTKARILRNGLAISSFVAIEDFFKGKIGEIIAGIKSTSIAFGLLDDNLKEAATLTAIASIHNRANTLKRNGSNYISFIQDETKKVASSKNGTYKLSSFSLGWGRSNVQYDEIKNWLKIFKIRGGWDTLNQITSKAQVAVLSTLDTLKGASMRRHSAAHDPKKGGKTKRKK